MDKHQQYIIPLAEDHRLVWQRGDIGKWTMDGHALPDFAGHDEVTLSAIPRGQIAHYVWLKEEPEHFFFAYGVGDSPDAAKAVRAANAG